MLRFALVLSDESLLKEAGRWDNEEEWDREDREDVDDDEDEGAEEFADELCAILSSGFLWAAVKEHSPTRGLRHQVFQKSSLKKK